MYIYKGIICFKSGFTMYSAIGQFYNKHDYKYRARCKYITLTKLFCSLLFRTVIASTVETESKTKEAEKTDLDLGVVGGY